MDLRHVGGGGVLIGDKGGERAGRGLVVPFRRGILGFLPGAPGRRAAERPVLAADLGRIQAGAYDPAHLLHDIGQRPAYERNRRPIQLTAFGVVAGRARRCTEPDSAEIGGVVGDRGEVEGAREFHRSLGLTRVTRLPDFHFLASGEPVGVGRAQACAEEVRIHRYAGVDVEVAPENLPLGLMVRAKRCTEGGRCQQPGQQGRDGGEGRTDTDHGGLLISEEKSRVQGRL